MMHINVNREECTGCTACASVCPCDAVSMKADARGFLYPVVDERKCISCGQCANVCPLNDDKKITDEPICYAAKTRDPRLLLDSSSGGLFTELAKNVLANRGCVFGCVFEESVAVHTIAEDLAGVARMRGSKYVQSDLQRSFILCKQKVDEGRPVLFSGTPCQIAGLKAYLGKEYDNLICVGLICHGVASPLLLKKYIDCESELWGEKVLVESFRDKRANPGNPSVILKIGSKKAPFFWWENVYMRAFLDAYSYRTGCFNCKFRNGRSGVDILIGDFWGVENCSSRFSMAEGVSAVLAYTQKGRQLFNSIDVEKLTVGYADIAKYNYNLDHNAAVPNDCDLFWSMALNGDGLFAFYRSKDFVPLWRRIIRKLRRVLGKMFGAKSHG